MVISLACRTMQGDAFVMLTVMMTDPLTANGSCKTQCVSKRIANLIDPCKVSPSAIAQQYTHPEHYGAIY